ncbi:MAG: DUF423 domain-containing protein [Chitinophagaceae bacterium]|nr:MAG: DUF423 domain-containing protein [Chitinophagaceae bacterium]
MHKGFLITGALLAAIAVALGAFGAHGLKKIVPVETISTFDTGVKYQFYHCLALLLVAMLFEKYPGAWMSYAGYAFIAGILLFSGSLYVLTLLKATGTVGLNGIGIITPFGGLFLITGWILMAVAFMKGARL